MDIRKVKKLIELLQASEVSEIEIHEGEESVRISRGMLKSTVAEPPIVSAPQEISAAPVFEASPSSESSKQVTAPMVGIFYNSPSPDTKPFVEIGQPVRAGDALCIIEAMKIMNQIESDLEGKISNILVKNGEPVEYGQPLFMIE